MSRTLLVIDIQNDYFPGGVLPLHQAEEIETRVVDAIDQARQAGERIVLVRHVSPAPTGLFAANGTGNSIRPKVLAAAGDASVVIKQFADAFQETDLAKVLEGTTELLVCGMMTQNCVVFTAMSRAADSLDVTVISDLCTGPSEIVHNIALNALGSKLSLKTAAEIWT